MHGIMSLKKKVELMCPVSYLAVTLLHVTDGELTDGSEPQQRQVPSGAVPLSNSLLHQLLKFKGIYIIYINLLMRGCKLYFNADIIKFRCIFEAAASSALMAFGMDIVNDHILLLTHLFIVFYFCT